MENKEQDKVLLAVELIRNNTKEIKLTKSEDLAVEPISLNQDELNTLWQDISNNEEYVDIKKIKQSKNIYFYSDISMTSNYATMLARIEDKDLLKIVAETVRNESKLYPRPTEARLFYISPFSFDENVFEDVLEKLKEHDDYKDICKTKASNGALYLYSNKYMSKDHAEALTEWIEVLQDETP